MLSVIKPKEVLEILGPISGLESTKFIDIRLIIDNENPIYFFWDEKAGKHIVLDDLQHICEHFSLNSFQAKTLVSGMYTLKITSEVLKPTQTMN